LANAKGTTLLGAVRFLRHHRERAAKLLSPQHQHYLEERIQESRWYPEADLLALIEVMLQLLPGPRDESLPMMGTHSARDHMAGIYSHLSGSGKGCAPSQSRAFAIWASQHDTGRFRVEQLGPDKARMTLRDFGHPSETMCGVFTGYFAELLRLDGARDVVATKTGCVLRGDPACSWDVSHAADEPASEPY